MNTNRRLPLIGAATAREKAVIRASQIAPLLAGELSCTYQVWLQSNYEDYPTIPDDKSWDEWNRKHTQLLEDTRADLLRRNHTVYTEGQNTFNLEGAAGFVKGKCDLVSLAPDGTWTILDPKSGKPKASHITQVLLYMWLLPYTEKYKGIVFNGAVVYKGNAIPIPHESLTPQFIASAKAKIIELGSDTPAIKNASPGDCRFCRIPQLICPERWDEKSGSQKVDLF